MITSRQAAHNDCKSNHEPNIGIESWHRKKFRRKANKKQTHKKQFLKGNKNQHIEDYKVSEIGMCTYSVISLVIKMGNTFLLFVGCEIGQNCQKSIKIAT